VAKLGPVGPTVPAVVNVKDVKEYNSGSGTPSTDTPPVIVTPDDITIGIFTRLF
jgi:hypothetical protein